MTLNLDALVLENNLSDDITSQVETVFQTHGQTFPVGYALSWIIANQVVQRYYGSKGLDAIPVWRDNFGWTQFNLTRAASCTLWPNPAAESQRYIVFDAIAVNWGMQAYGGEGQYDVVTAMSVQNQTPLMAINGAVLHLDLEDGWPEADHSACLHGPHCYTYTKLFSTVTNLICQAPELVARREIIVDQDMFDQPLPEAVHPLRQLGLAEAGITRDWFELFYVPANRRVFVNVFTGDLCYTESDDTPRAVEYPGWNELNEEQLASYLGGLLGVPDHNLGL